MNKKHRKLNYEVLNSNIIIHYFLFYFFSTDIGLTLWPF
jgi:hypothetical protein